MHWSMFLADFDYKIKYIRGEDNTAADALSRMPDELPSPSFAACSLAHTRFPSRSSLSAATLDISADKSLLLAIVNGYKSDNFAKHT